MTSSRPKAALIGEEARFVVLTGLSGSGKSEAIRALEDLGYFCVDNLPTRLITRFADLTGRQDGQIERAALVVDMRDPAFLDQFPDALAALRKRPELGAVLIFLDANDGALVRRFSETRRPHPLGAETPLAERIVEERRRLDPIRKIADDIFDTSELTVHELRRAFMDLSRGGAQKQLVVTFLSFGFKHGLPLEADLVFDVRFLPNPFFVPELKALTGRDAGVQEYVNTTQEAQTFQKKVSDLLGFLVPQYAAEGKSYLTVAVGCTGGRHRSVVIADQLRRALAPISDVRSRVKHRDIFTE